MGFYPADKIQSAAMFLIHFLDTGPDGKATMSLLYDGTDERHNDLMEWLDFEDDDCLPETAIDFAALQLEEVGLIEITELDVLLADGEKDYQMEITTEGRQFIKDELEFDCYSVEM